MAFRAAQTGHLLLSTLHTETAIASVGRLLDLGIDRNSLSSAIIGVLGQRLVRQVCTGCETTYQPAPELLREFFRMAGQGSSSRRARAARPATTADIADA